MLIQNHATSHVFSKYQKKVSSKSKSILILGSFSDLHEIVECVFNDLKKNRQKLCISRLKRCINFLMDSLLLLNVHLYIHGKKFFFKKDIHSRQLYHSNKKITFYVIQNFGINPLKYPHFIVIRNFGINPLKYPHFISEFYLCFQYKL